MLNTASIFPVYQRSLRFLNGLCYILLLEFVLSKWHGFCTAADFEELRAVLLTLEVAGVKLKSRKHFSYLHSGLDIWIREKIWVVVDINLPYARHYNPFLKSISLFSRSFFSKNYVLNTSYLTDSYNSFTLKLESRQKFCFNSSIRSSTYGKKNYFWFSSMREDYSIVKDSSADIGVNSKIVQIRPTVKAVCTKISNFFFAYLSIFLRENKEASFFLFWIFKLKQP